MYSDKQFLLRRPIATSLPTWSYLVKRFPKFVDKFSTQEAGKRAIHFKKLKMVLIIKKINDNCFILTKNKLIQLYQRHHKTLKSIDTYDHIRPLLHKFSRLSNLQISLYYFKDWRIALSQRSLASLRIVSEKVWTRFGNRKRNIPKIRKKLRQKLLPILFSRLLKLLIRSPHLKEFIIASQLDQYIIRLMQMLGTTLNDFTSQPKLILDLNYNEKITEDQLKSIPADFFSKVIDMTLDGRNQIPFVNLVLQHPENFLSIKSLSLCLSDKFRSYYETLERLALFEQIEFLFLEIHQLNTETIQTFFTKVQFPERVHTLKLSLKHIGDENPYVMNHENTPISISEESFLIFVKKWKNLQWLEHLDIGFDFLRVQGGLRKESIIKILKEIKSLKTLKIFFRSYDNFEYTSRRASLLKIEGLDLGLFFRELKDNLKNLEVLEMDFDRLVMTPSLQNLVISMPKLKLISLKYSLLGSDNFSKMIRFIKASAMEGCQENHKRRLENLRILMHLVDIENENEFLSVLNELREMKYIKGNIYFSVEDLEEPMIAEHIMNFLARLNRPLDIDLGFSVKMMERSLMKNIGKALSKNGQISSFLIEGNWGDYMEYHRNKGFDISESEPQEDFYEDYYQYLDANNAFNNALEVVV